MYTSLFNMWWFKKTQSDFVYLSVEWSNKFSLIFLYFIYLGIQLADKIQNILVASVDQSLSVTKNEEKASGA